MPQPRPTSWDGQASEDLNPYHAVSELQSFEATPVNGRRRRAVSGSPNSRPRSGRVSARGGRVAVSFSGDHSQQQAKELG